MRWTFPGLPTQPSSQSPLLCLAQSLCSAAGSLQRRNHLPRKPSAVNICCSIQDEFAPAEAGAFFCTLRNLLRKRGHSSTTAPITSSVLQSDKLNRCPKSPSIRLLMLHL